MATNQTIIKNLIASELSDFLLRENIKPDVIKIEVHYKGTIASMYIDPGKIENLEVSDNEQRETD